MLAIVSHDLRNLLNVMTTALSFLSLGDRSEDERGAIDASIAAARSMTDLIEDLLEITTLEAGSFSMEAKPEPPERLANTACERFEALAARKSIALVCAGGMSTLPPVLADARRIHQVFANLVGNAIKFSPPHTSVRIAAELEEDEIRFSVGDEGCGIAKEALPYVFDRFWQSRNAGRGSVGLGLAIAKGIVEAHGGRIWVESEPGAGSTFFFTLHVVKGSDRLARVG
jgi:signal transduction histidine kinase